MMKRCKHPQVTIAEETVTWLYFEWDGHTVEDGCTSAADPTGRYTATCWVCSRKYSFRLIQAIQGNLPGWVARAWQAVMHALKQDTVERLL